ncbi:hypothetical protein M0R72_12570 [Candidatus Pacearchaeota archaeon]|jgi:hypothetical protein|nr:hypothetical protein [Candidatus Pacearchaeota archaeon]
MSEAKHTAGPWHTDRRYGCHAIVDSKGQDLCYQDVEAYSGPGEPAGSVTSRGRTTFELEANARLIAAAPDLLAACKELFALACMPSQFTESKRQKLLDHARDAIARAEKP